MSTPLNLIHLTDLHIQAAGAKPYLGLDTFGNTQAVLDMIRTLGIKPDGFILSDDLTDTGDEAAYARLETLTEAIGAEFGVPVLLALGNHDNRAAFCRVVLGQSDGDENARYYYSQLINGWRVIVLDWNDGTGMGGTLDASQLAWLGQELAVPVGEGTIEGTVLVVHHPPTSIPLDMLSTHMLVSAPELANVVRGHHIDLLLSGHVHFNTLRLWEGILCGVGTAIAYSLDPAAVDALNSNDQFGFNLVAARSGQLTVNPILMPGTKKQLHSMSAEALNRLLAQEHSAPSA